MEYSSVTEHFSLPGELGLADFDPDFGLDLQTSNGLPMPRDQALAEAREELNIYGLTIEPEDFSKNPHTLASEVGDDEQEVSDSKLLLAFTSVFSRHLGMKTSRADTSINKRYGNFCEEMIVLPDGYEQTYQSARNTSRYKDMSFIDIPKIRLATNIRPMKLDHSSTNDGKASMVGSRLKWLPKDNPMKILYEVFNLYQDVSLGMTTSKKFAYLPTELGGYGKPVPFSNFRNFESFMASYKHGAHSPVIRTITRRALRFMEKISNGVRPEPDILLSHVSRFSGSFHDWVKGHSIYAPTAWIDIPEELVQFQVGRLGESPVKDDVFCRLIAENLLVTESKLQVVVEHNHLCKALSGAQTIPEFRAIREAATKEWRKLSVFGRETYGLIKEINPDQTDFRPLRDIEVMCFLKEVENRRGLLRPLFGNEPIYLRTAIDHVYAEGPMFVPFQMTPRNKIGGMQFVEQSRFREDAVDTEDREAEPLLLQWVKDGFQGSPPRRLINDDEDIIVQASNAEALVIVTDDIALCKKANRVSKTPIFRVPCEWYYRCVYMLGIDSDEAPWMEFLKKRTGKTWSWILDEGSFASAEESLFDNGVMLKVNRTRPFSMTKGYNTKDRAHLEPLEDIGDAPNEHPDTLLYDKYGFLTRRHRRVFRRETSSA